MPRPVPSEILLLSPGIWPAFTNSPPLDDGGGLLIVPPKCWTENPTFGGHIMSKISNEIRLEAVQRVVEDGMSISASARLVGVHKSMLQEWIMQYREHGAEGVIKQDRKQKKYWRI